MRKIYYCKKGGKVPVEDFINNSSEKVRKKFLFCIGYVLGETGNLSEPYIKHISINKYSMLYELRFKADGKYVRVMFYEEDDNIYLLHAFYKTNRRDTDRNLAYAAKALEILQATQDVKRLSAA